MQIWQRIGKSLRERPGIKDVESLASATNMSAIVASANAALYVLATWHSFNRVFLVTWLSVCVLVNAALVVRTARFRTHQVKQVSKRLSRRLVQFSVLMAAPWAILTVAAVAFGGTFDQLMALVICSGTLAGATFIMHRLTAACISFQLTIQVPLAIACLLTDPARFWPLIASSLIYEFSLFTAAMSTARTARQRDQSVADSRRTVVELETAYETISKLAFFDITTDLPNRKGFVQGLDDAMEAADRTGGSFTLLMLDLDRFKNVNDTLGHHVGDRLLAIVAERLGANIAPEDILARLGGDEFAIIVQSARTTEELEELSLRLVASVNQPAMIGAHEVHIGTSIGGARYPADATNSHQLMMYADISLNRAKESGRGCFVLFDEAIRLQIDRREWIETELRKAMEHDQLHMVYQPKVDLFDGSIVGAEALVRWTHPQAGPIMPTEFLSVAAERGLISTMTRCIVSRIARDLSDWRRCGLDIGKVAMNLHPLDLKSSADLLVCLESFAAEHVRPDDLILEITEGSIVGRGTDATPLVLDSLTERGFDLSLDDFGTGYASLSHLLKMPVKEIKVDRGFIRGLTKSPADRAIISAAVEIARLMSLRVVAEGVETVDQVEELRSLGIRTAQGYHWSGPMEIDDFEALVRAGGFAAIAPNRSLAG